MEHKTKIHKMASPINIAKTMWIGWMKLNVCSRRRSLASSCGTAGSQVDSKSDVEKQHKGTSNITNEQTKHKYYLTLTLKKMAIC